jgi:hypothetical protein
LTHKTQSFTITDPRSFDGNPYEVAIRSIEQAAGLATLYKKALDDAFVMVRNAEMERQLALGDDADPTAFRDGPQGKQIINFQGEIAAQLIRFKGLTMAAGYDPKNPPRA